MARVLARRSQHQNKRNHLARIHPDIRDRPHQKLPAWHTSIHALIPRPDQFLIVNIRTNTPISPNTDTPLNPVHPNCEQQAENERWLHTCATVITTWVRATGFPVLVAPEAEKEIAAATKFLRPRLPADILDRDVFRNTWWNADEALSTFTRARVAFGVEPHTLIMAMTGGVPILHARPLRHGRKGWMFRDLGLGDNLFDIDTTPAGPIAARLLHLHEDHAAARTAASREVRRRQHHTLDVIEKALAPGAA